MINRENNENRPKVGLALSGGSIRSITHIGVLEVLQKNNIPVDYIAACSSASVVAASFACGTMDELKRDWMAITPEQRNDWIGRDSSNGGLYHLRKAELMFRKYTRNEHFEDVRPRLAFPAVDLQNGEQVPLQMGDLARAIRIACSVPGMFEPVQWGRRLLVDGGLLDTIPVDVARQMGANIVIAVDIAASRYIFMGKLKWLVFLWKQYYFFKKSWPVQAIKKLSETIRSEVNEFWPEFFDPYADPDLDEKKSSLQMLSRALDVLVEKRYNKQSLPINYEYVIEPKVKHLRADDLSVVEFCYQEGRRAAAAAMPQILQMMKKRGVIA